MYNTFTMEEKSYKSLKSGSDIRGIAVQTEDGDVTLTRKLSSKAAANSCTAD